MSNSLGVSPSAPGSSSQAPPIPDAEEALTLLGAADDLLGIAWSAMLKLGLGDRGSDVGLSHEVRMFALHFSMEGRDGPGLLQVNGTGDFMAWRRAARALQARARDRREPATREPGSEGTRPGERT